VTNKTNCHVYGNMIKRVQKIRITQYEKRRAKIINTELCWIYIDWLHFLQFLSESHSYNLVNRYKTSVRFSSSKLERFTVMFHENEIHIK
jgi:hypothetical protein